MKIEEANKIISEFMDCSSYGDDCLYSESLDDQLSAWLKIGKNRPDILQGLVQMCQVNDYTENEIKQGLCIATAKAIQSITS